MRRLIPPLTLLGLVLALAGALRAQDAPPPLLTTCGEVRALSREQAARRMPVVARGVVTLLSLPVNSFTLDDGTGVWVELRGPAGDVRRPAALRVGDLVEVHGVTHEGLFAPLISASDVRIVGRGALPPPQAIETVGLNSSQYGSQRVRLDGVVQSAEAFAVNGHDEFRLSVATEMGHFDFVLLARSPLPPDSLVDAEVALTGVALCEHNNRRQFTGLRVFSNDPADVRVTRAAPGAPLDAPEIDLRDVMVFSPRGTNLHRRRVEGVVALGNPGHYLYIENHGEGLRINSTQADALRPGDVVEAAGFFQMDNFRAEMAHAVFRVIGHQAAPAPVPITPEDAFRFKPGTAFEHPRDFDDRLVTLRGRLVGVEQIAGTLPVLNLEAGGHFFVATFARAAADGVARLRPGSVLAVTGILAISYANPPDALDWQRPTAVQVLLRDAADVAVLRAASWWTTGRLQAALGILVLVLALAMAWSVLLRRRVAQRGEELAAAIRAKRDEEVEFESTLRERNRLAADLHDTMEQALTGLALQLEASDALQAQSAAASNRHLVFARQLLARSREDLRRSIWNLRSSRLEQKTLLQALREMAADRGVGQRTRLEVHHEGGDRSLPEWIAGNLLLLAQECITNALKHADASVVRITLRVGAREVTLDIHDDGRGFDPAAAAGAKEGHFGVQGMRERVKRLGGTLRIESLPGAGTRVTVRVPVEERAPDVAAPPQPAAGAVTRE